MWTKASMAFESSPAKHGLSVTKKGQKMLRPQHLACRVGWEGAPARVPPDHRGWTGRSSSARTGDVRERKRAPAPSPVVRSRLGWDAWCGRGRLDSCCRELFWSYFDLWGFVHGAGRVVTVSPIHAVSWVNHTDDLDGHPRSCEVSVVCFGCVLSFLTLSRCNKN